MRLARVIHCVDAHAEGEPSRIVVGGVLDVPGGSMLEKMAGDRWQKLANLRALYAYMWAHPGKKLLFMGNEIAQEVEWNFERSLDWHLLERAEHGQPTEHDSSAVCWILENEPAGSKSATNSGTGSARRRPPQPISAR